MRVFDQRRDGLFSYVRPDSRIPNDHPLRVIRKLADEGPGSNPGHTRSWLGCQDG